MTLTFTASVDHTRTDPITGDPVIASYEIWVYDGASPFELIGTENLGKPTPNGSNVITITDSTLLNGLEIGSYTGQIYALGPLFETAPDQMVPSSTFAFDVTEEGGEPEPPVLTGSGRRYIMLGGA
jgi:hypothetical protein